MFGRNMVEAPVRERSGLVPRMLLQEDDVTGAGLTATWVDVAPGSRQRLHDHGAEQVYVVLGGRGKMRVGRGDLVYIPPGAAHGIENASEETLVYVPAATPAMDTLAAYDAGQIRPEGAEGRGA